MPTEQKPDHPPPPPKQMGLVSPLGIKEQERVKKTSLVIGCVTTPVVAVAGGEREDGRVGPGGTADYREWSPSWQGKYPCQRVGPPYPG